MYCLHYRCQQECEFIVGVKLGIPVKTDVMSSGLRNLSRQLSSCPDLGDPPVKYTTEEAGAIIFFLVILMMLTVAGNLLVILSVILFRQMRTLTNFFVLSLAAADILVATLVMPFGAYSIYVNLEWNLGQTMCKVATCFDVMLTTSSILHLSCLAMDRYYAICSPFFYHERITKRTVKLLLVGCWVIPIIISWIPIMNSWNTLGIEDVISCMTPPDGKACIFLVNMPYALFGSIIAFYGPTIFMFLVNLKIYNEAKRQALQIRSLEMTTFHAKGQKPEKDMRQERKAAKTLSVIMGCFCACWCPFFFFNILDPMVGYRIPFTIWQLAVWLGYVNSTINPFLYYFFNRTFRRAFIKVILCYKCRGIKDHSEAMVTNFSQISD